MSDRELIVATENPHKLEEYAALLRDVPATLSGLSGRDIRLPEETGETFVDNALLKARYCAREAGSCSLADDSGIEVDALGGEPGVRSSRWAGPGRSDADRVRLLLERVDGVPEAERTARFRCALAVVTPDGRERVWEGTLEGKLASVPTGNEGFGYDPVMYLPELGLTVAELPPERKNEISHRARAVQAALPWLREYFGDLT